MTAGQGCAIAGVGTTAFGKTPGRTTYDLNVEAIRAAVADAGLRREDVDGVVCKYPTSGFTSLYAAKVAAMAGIEPLVCATIDQAGATAIGAIQYAVMAIEAGLATTIVCCYGDNPRTGSTGTYSRPRGTDAAYGAFGVAWGYGMLAQRHMLEYGTKPEHLAAVAIACRKHGAMNPAAQLAGKPLTLAAYFDGRYIAEPLRRDDCCLISDGGAAVVVTTLERARTLRRKPVRVLGMGQSHPAAEVQDRPSLTVTGAHRSGEAAFRMAGVTPRDIDVAQLYDCYTITLLTSLEDYGFCGKGEAGAFVEGGRIELGGALPVNTAGGLLAETGMPGLQLVVEGVRQLRGEGGDRQVPDAELCLVSGQGGIMHTHSTLILGAA